MCGLIKDTQPGLWLQTTIDLENTNEEIKVFKKKSGLSLSKHGGTCLQVWLVRESESLFWGSSENLPELLKRESTQDENLFQGQYIEF